MGPHAVPPLRHPDRFVARGFRYGDFPDRVGGAGRGRRRRGARPATHRAARLAAVLERAGQGSREAGREQSALVHGATPGGGPPTPADTQGRSRARWARPGRRLASPSRTRRRSGASLAHPREQEQHAGHDQAHRLEAVVERQDAACFSWRWPASGSTSSAACRRRHAATSAAANADTIAARMSGGTVRTVGGSLAMISSGPPISPGSRRRCRGWWGAWDRPLASRTSTRRK